MTNDTTKLLKVIDGMQRVAKHGVPVSCETILGWSAEIASALTPAALDAFGVTDAEVKAAVYTFANQPSGSYDEGAEGRIMRAVLEQFAKGRASLATIPVEVLREGMMDIWRASQNVGPVGLDYVEWKIAELLSRAHPAAEPADDKYAELIYAVGNKYPGETRHQTALRYIRQAEDAGSEGAAKEAARGKV